MRLATIDGRAALVVGPDTYVDVHKASDGRFGPDTAALYADWIDFREWAQGAPVEDTLTFAPESLGPPSPTPRQILAVGLNYDDHASESGFGAPTDLPPVFPKFVSSLTGPVTTVELPADGHTDWEVELVLVIGRPTSNVAVEDAWDHVAGVTVGQDISERVLQLSGPAPQFGLGKSFRGFTPTGPWLVTVDELDDPDDLGLRCELDGETMQEGRTRDLIYPVSRLVSRLSEVIDLYPGDLVFTGTPAGVGLGRTPQRWIQPGEVLVSSIEGIGELRQTFVAAPAASGSAPSGTDDLPTEG